MSDPDDLPEIIPVWATFPAIGTTVSSDEVGYGQGGYGEGGYDTPSVSVHSAARPSWTVTKLK